MWRRSGVRCVDNSFYDNFHSLLTLGVYCTALSAIQSEEELLENLISHSLPSARSRFSIAVTVNKKMGKQVSTRHKCSHYF